MSIRLPWPGLDWTQAAHPLPPAAAHYLTVVRRLGPGAILVVFDGRGLEANATLGHDERGPLLVLDGPPVAGRSAAPVRLAYALPKGDKLEDVLRQVTELGAAGVLLFQGERSVVRLEPGDRADRKRERWLRIAEEAARQCGRADVPTVEGPMTFADALDRTASDPWRAVLHPEGGESLEALCPAAPATLFVGPEGGFSPGELTRFAAAGVMRLSLQCPVLRTETAAVVATALALHRLGSA